LKPLDLSGPFRNRVRAYPREIRGKIGRALQLLERDFGQPHQHPGLGIRKLTGNFFEIRVELDIRLVFQNRAECLLFVMAGNHDEVQKFLRGL
jgi:mRNA-degrading endonuclease YafQ of YafQ-DinJ toxin-antitoxin module